MKKKFLVVIWFLWLLSLGALASAQQYQLIYSEDFSTQPDGPLTGSWEQIHHSWAITNTRTISGGSAITTGDARDNSILLRPVSESFRNGKIQFVGISDTILSLWARLNGSASSASGFEVWVWIGRNYLYTSSMDNARIPNGAGQVLANNGLSLKGKTISGEMILQTDAGTSTMTLTLYDYDTQAFLWSGTHTFTNPSATGQWGVGSYFASSLKSIAFYREIEPLLTALTLDVNNIKVWTSLTYTLTTSELSDTVTLSDNGAGGTFSATNYLLDASNNRTITGTYTPNKAGNATLTANFASTGDKTVDIFVSPYSTTIGFIGDSVTAGTSIQNYVPNLLGQWFLAINYGVPGSRTEGWAIDNHGGSGIMTNALSAFSVSGVDIVHIMLGTNDAAGNVLSGVYKTNMQTIIDTLKSAGIKHILISGIPYIATNDLNNGDVSTQIKDASVRAYQQANAELVAENAGFVLSGDTEAYQWFKDNQNELANDYHPNSVGYGNLRDFRTQAISGAIHYQINPTASFLSGNTHTLWTTGSLTLRVDKYFGEFNNVVVDDTVLTSDKYVATSGSTTIELNADYLNTLTAGSHTLTVGFTGGVMVSSGFTILPDPTIIPPTPSSPSYGWGGGGWGSSVSKDVCPNGDFSPSYYDGTCGSTPTTGNVGTGLALSNTNESTQSDTPLDEKPASQVDNASIVPTTTEIQTAYDWAFKNNITTLSPIENANPTWTVIRGHLAKMVVNYALNVLWRTLPEKVPAYCHWKDGNNARESEEIRDYAVKACSLGLMGIDMEYFQPLLVVTRAQFGTILSRLLYGETFNGGTPYYVNHLQTLKKNWIMTQIDTPEQRKELRQWVWLMLMRSSEK